MKKFALLIVAAVFTIAGCAGPAVSTRSRAPDAAGTSLEGVAARTLDLRDFGRIKAKVLYVLSTTDKLFPPTIAPNVMAKLEQDAPKYEPALRAFLQSVESAR
jgi:hypothetical protein